LRGRDAWPAAAGDQLLRELADIMRANLRSYDIIVRLGGDEFVGGVSGLDPDAVTQLFTHITTALAQAGRASITVGLVTPFGGTSLTSFALRVTWHIVGLALVGFGLLLIAVAGDPSPTDRTLVLNTGAGMFAAATVVVLWLARHHPTNLLRLPVWTLFVLISVLCWINV